MRDLLPRSDELARVIDQIEIGIILDSEPVDLSEARDRLDAYRDQYGDSEWLASCDAYFTAIWEGDWKAGEARLWSRREANADGALRCAAAAAVAARAGDRQAMADRLDEMDAFVRQRSPFADLTYRDIRRQVEAALSETRAGSVYSTSPA